MTGVTVLLFERRRIGTDGFNAPVTEEIPVAVENVLYAPAGTSDEASDGGLSNDTSLLDLYIPKGDRHTWEGCRVEVSGAAYAVVGRPEEWMEANVPGPWNRRVRVRRYE